MENREWKIAIAARTGRSKGRHGWTRTNADHRNGEGDIEPGVRLNHGRGRSYSLRRASGTGATAVIGRSATRRRFSFGVLGVLGARLLWVSCLFLLLRIGFWIPGVWIRRRRSNGLASDLRNYSRRCRRWNRWWILWW